MRGWGELGCGQRVRVCMCDGQNNVRGMRPTMMYSVDRWLPGRPGILELGAGDRHAETMSGRDRVRTMPQRYAERVNIACNQRFRDLMRVAMRRQEPAIADQTRCAIFGNVAEFDMEVGDLRG